MKSSLTLVLDHELTKEEIQVAKDAVIIYNYALEFDEDLLLLIRKYSRASNTWEESQFLHPVQLALFLLYCETDIYTEFFKKVESCVKLQLQFAKVVKNRKKKIRIT